MRKFLIILIVIYSPNQKTEKIKIFDLVEKEPVIEIICAEGVSYSECMGDDRPKVKIDSVSYEDI